MVKPGYEDSMIGQGRKEDKGKERRGWQKDRFLFRIPRFFTKKGVHPYDLLKWEKRKAVITSSSGEVIFEKEGVEFPSSWTQLATNVVVNKYFKTGLKPGEGEKSLKQVIDRVVKTLSEWGEEGGYFQDSEARETFAMELTHVLVNQYASFNSPIWFNVGVEKKPQCSACFINSVEDTMESILNLAYIEGMLFKYGSGTGTNFSTLRSSREKLSNGGTPSGPVSFMKGFDAFAGVIKSGGRTRRAAKMVILNIDHPDIVEFIRSKEKEEKKAWKLIEAGYSGTFGGEAYGSVFFQNSNNSVRVTDEFMEAVEKDLEWSTKAVTTGEVVETFKAGDLMRMIAKAAHVCGDPGLQFDTIINKWNTCKASGRINASNPCSEFMFLDDSACNLASINLLKFRRPDGTFDVTAFRQTIRVILLAQEIIVDPSFYPTEKIEKNSHGFRPLGLGYANLGALLMSLGLPYDSEEGRNYAAALTSLMTGEAYRVSAELARAMGPFAEFEKNRESMLEVVELHKKAAYELKSEGVPAELLEASRSIWDKALELGSRHGFRNAQVTVLAPTGTIGFMIDCDSMGVEPDIALVKYKRLVGVGVFKIVNQTVSLALKRLGYQDDEIGEIIDWIKNKDMIEGAPHLKEEHLPVFDCAFKPRNGKRFISYKGHIKMMAAVQPFISGAISKTVNLPESTTAEEIQEIYMDAWRMGLKAIAVYRENSKKIQPVSTSDEERGESKAKPRRRRLPMTRKSITHKFSIAGHEGYITVGMYDDGTPGEMFVKMAKEGTVVSGLMDSLATVASIALQFGVPLEVLVAKFAHTRFEPAGITENPNIRFAKSIMDYIGRWLAITFLPPEKQPTGKGMWHPMDQENGGAIEKGGNHQPNPSAYVVQADAPVCESCGTLMTRNGNCYKCDNCGNTSGCS